MPHVVLFSAKSAGSASMIVTPIKLTGVAPTFVKVTGMLVLVVPTFRLENVTNVVEKDNGVCRPAAPRKSGHSRLAAARRTPGSPSVSPRERRDLHVIFVVKEVLSETEDGAE
jgi:hypothetical protein